MWDMLKASGVKCAGQTNLKLHVVFGALTCFCHVVEATVYDNSAYTVACSTRDFFYNPIIFISFFNLDGCIRGSRSVFLIT